VSHSQPSGAPGRGVMRRLAGGAGSARFAGVFQFADAIFSPSKSAAYTAREEQRRRRVAVPAPADPPDGGPAADDATAIPTGLLGAVLTDGPPDDAAGLGPAAPLSSASAQGEHGSSAMD
jgi:hypothetical protein